MRGTCEMREDVRQRERERERRGRERRGREKGIDGGER
jgi:hypothetical protein